MTKIELHDMADDLTQYRHRKIKSINLLEQIRLKLKIKESGFLKSV